VHLNLRVLSYKRSQPWAQQREGGVRQPGVSGIFDDAGKQEGASLRIADQSYEGAIED
jgi:hypothetical protein